MPIPYGDPQFVYLDTEEQTLIENIASAGPGISQINETRSTIESAARQYNEKKKINISLYSRDINTIKHKAREYGIPYQTLVSMVIRQFANDKVKIELS